ncbi:hypothetical protein Zmor_008341 [Zophobas morio]|uniref:Uncharacterized protein n=1 Tax=Zophobas morio TaxID=2755281 RepID=A0AA38IXU0_9CUCU|nr:hypothetical protein Zmor_008341 [Zophobas morio]
MQSKTLVFLLCVVVLAEGLTIHKRPAHTKLSKESLEKITELVKSDDCPQWVPVDGGWIDWCDPAYHPDR